MNPVAAMTDASPQPGEGRPRARSWFIIAVIVGAMLLSAMDRQALNLLGPMIQDDLGITDTQLGVLNGFAFIALNAIGTLIVGWAADRFNRRTIIMIGVAIWSGATAACGFASTFPALLAARAVVGGGEATVVPAGYSLATDSFPPSYRGRVMGILVSANTIGGGLAIMACGMLLALIGPGARIVPFAGSMAPWQIVFLMLGLLGIPMLALLMCINDVRRSRASRLSERDIGTGPGTIAHMRRFPTLFAGLYVTSSFNAIAGFGIVSWAAPLLLRRFPIDTPMAGLIVGLAFMIGGGAGGLSAAALSDRWRSRGLPGGRLRGHVPLLLLSVGGLLLFTLGPSAQLCGVGLAAIAFSMNAINAIGFATLHDLTPSHMRGSATAYLQFGVMVLGISIGPISIALLTDYLFADKAMLPLSMLIAAGSLFAVAIVGAIVAVGRMRAGDGDRAALIVAE